MASRHEIVTIDFRANAAKANPAMESLRSSAYDLRQEIEKTQKDINEGIKTGRPQAELDKLSQKLANQERQLRSFNQAISTLSKGVGTLSRAIDAFNTGTLDNMSAAFQKSAYNAAEVAKKALRPDSKTYQKDMAELDALQQKNLENLAKYKLRTEQLLNSIDTGGKISSQDLKQEENALRELMQLLPHMGREWLEYNQLLTRVTEATKLQAEAEKRLAGAIVDANDARQRATQLNRDGAEAAARQHKEAKEEVAVRKQIIEGLEKERDAKQKQVSDTAALAIAKDKEVEKERKNIAAIQERIDNEDRDAKNTKKKIDKLNEEATSLENNAKTSRETAESMKTDLKGVQDEIKQVNEELAKMGANTQGTAKNSVVEGIKQDAKEAKEEVKNLAREQENLTEKKTVADEKQKQTSEKKTAAKKEEVKVEEKIVETQKEEKVTADDLVNQGKALRAQAEELLKEKDELIKKQEESAKATTAEAAAYKDLTKEQADAMLKQKQALATFKNEGGKWQVSNREEAQSYLFKALGEIEPSNVGKSRLQITSTDQAPGDEKISELLGKFKERYGMQSDDDAMGAIRELMSGGLVKNGFMNKFLLNLEQDTDKVKAFGSEIKTLTDIVNGNTEAIEENAAAEKRIAEIDVQVVDLNKQSNELFARATKLRNDRVDFIEKDVKAEEKLAEAHKKNGQALRELVEQYKNLSKEQAKAEVDKMTERSSVGYKEGKLSMSNTEEVQQFIISQMRSVGKAGRGGTLKIEKTQVDNLLKDFQTRYGWTGDKDNAQKLLKQIVQGTQGGLLKKGGFAEFGKGIQNLTIKYDEDAYTQRMNKIKVFNTIANDMADSFQNAEELFERKIKSTRELLDGLKKDLEEKENVLKQKQKELSSTPTKERKAKEQEIADYKKDVISPLKKRITYTEGKLENAASDYADIKGLPIAIEAEKQETEATERTTRSKRGKAKATKETADATKEATKASKEATDQTAKENAEDQKRQGLLQKKQELETKEGKLIEDIADKEEKAAGMEQQAANKRADATKAAEEQAGAHEKNAEAMGIATDKMKKLTDQQDFLHGKLAEGRKEIAEYNKKIDENADAQQKAEQKAAQTERLTIDAMNEAIKVLEEKNRVIEPESKEWQENIRVIQQYKAEIDRLKQQPVLQMMTERLGNVKNLSSEALGETIRFWKTMEAGAERGSHKLEVAAGNVKMLMEEERQRRMEIQKPMRENLNNLGTLSTNSLADTKKYWETVRDGAEAGSAAYKKAELAVKALNNEENRRKSNAQAQYIRDQMADLNNLSVSGLAEVKKYWQAMYDGAKKGSDEMKDAEAALKRINALETENLKTSADRLNGNLGRMSQGDLRQAIDDAKKYQSTLGSTSDEAKKLAQAIVNAEEHIKRYGVEAEREARRQEEADKRAARAARDKADAEMQSQQEQRTMMMQRSMESQRTKLSAEALAETKKYWEAVARGAEEGSVAQRNALTIMQRITDEELRRNKAANERKASILDGTLSNYSEAEIRAAIEAGKELIQTYKVGSTQATELAEKIVTAENYVKQYGVEAERIAQQQAKSIADMKNQLSQGTSLSQQALKAQEKYWQELIDDPKTAITILDEYRANLEQVHELQKQLAAEEVNIAGKGVLDRMRGDINYEDKISENQRKEDVAALQAYRDSLPKEGNASVLKEIDYYLKQLGATAQNTAKDVMSVNDALMLAAKAGTSAFAATPQEIQAATKAIEKQRDAIIQTIKVKRESGQATDKEEMELQDLTNKLRGLKFELDNVNMSQAKMQALMEEPANAVNLDELRAAIKRADGQLRIMKDSLGEGSKQYQDFAEKVKNAKNELKEMEGQAKANTSAWDKAWSRLKTYVGMYMGFNMVWQRITGSVDDLMTLSDKMGEVRKTTGFTADEVGRLSDNLQKLDTRTDLTGLMEFSSLAGSIGMKTQKDVQGFTEAANMLAVSLPEMGNEASRSLIKIADATGDLEKNGGNVRETLERVGSTIIALRANSAAAAGPITDFVSRVGAVGAQAGISIDQIAALGATVDALGGRVEMSATALSRMIPAIKNNTFEVANAIGMTEKELKGMTGMEQMVAIFRKLHDSVKQFDMNTEDGMNGAADAVENMLGRSVSMQDVMKQLNQQGARAGIVFGLLSQNVDKLEEQLGTAREAYSNNVALMNEYNKMNDTAAGKWARLKNQLEEFFVNADAQSWISDVIDWLRKLIDLITEEGPIGRFFRWSLVYLSLWKAKWAEAIGTALISLGQYIFATKQSTAATAADTAAKTADAAATEATAVANEHAAVASGKFNKTMKANVIAAVATAVVALGWALYEYAQKAKNAAKQMDVMADVEKKAREESVKERAELEKLYKVTQDQTASMEERKKALKDMVGDAKYQEYYSKLSTESELAATAASAYKELSEQILATARARALDAKAEELQRRRVDLEDQRKDREDWENENRGKYRAGKQEYTRQQAYVGNVTGGATAGFQESQIAQRGSAAMKPAIIDEFERSVRERNRINGEIEQIDKDLDKLKQQVSKLNIKPDAGDGGGGGGGGGNNPYGNYDRVKSDYNDWDANALVNRRKEMLERVRALANGADVQAVLSEDAKFISEAVRKNIKTTKDAIEWYNTERLKIQEALHGKHLTNTGDWMDPKQQKIRRKLMQDDMKAYLEELDAYYTERKTRIQEAGNEEGVTEAEVRNRTLANEMEWRQRRAELQIMYSKRAKEITQQEQDAISEIIAERTGDDAKYIKKTIEQTVKFSEAIRDANAQGAKEYRKFQGDLDLGSEKDFNKVQMALRQQLKAIEDIIDKERPFNGITKNLRENLVTMGILTADMSKERDRLMKENADMMDFNARQAAEEVKRTAFMLGEAENAYSTTIEDVMRHMADAGMQAWADEVRKSSEMQDGLMAQLRSTYDAIQDAIKKEASQIKKQAEIMWNNILMPDGQTTLKDATDRAIAQLSLDQNRVSRANSLIGAGASSERVADKLAIKQMQMQLTMQEHYYNLMKKKGMEQYRILLAQAEAARLRGDYEEATRKELDAQHAMMALNLATAKEETELAKQREEIIARTEESQNRLYTELREWGNLLSSSVQSMMEASHAGDAEYYNERAKMELTGKGGPGAGTYIIIDNEGTEDARAHYEYLDERQALEREREIERQNAMADAWKKMMDDLNNKMNEQITDWMNSALQTQSLDANTQAVIANTQAIYASMGQGEGADFTDVSGQNRNASGQATDKRGLPIAPIEPAEGEGMPQVPWQMTEEQRQQAEENMGQLWTAYKEFGIAAHQEMSEAQSELPTPMADPLNITPEMAETAGQNAANAYNAVADAKIAASDRETEVIEKNAQKQKQATLAANNQEQKSTQSMFAKMTAAANMYGTAYQIMSNDNLSATQKFEMFALQAAGQAAISMLTTDLFKAQSDHMVQMPGILGKLLGQMPYPAAMATYAAVTALMGGLMGLAVSKVSKAKSQIASVTGASTSAGRLATGMLTYAEGNVNEFTDPASLTPGRSYNVDGADGKTYRAKYTGTRPTTHLTNGPEFHLAGEKGREMIIDAGTTRQITMNDNEIWKAIKTLSGGGRVQSSRRRRSGVRAFAEGNVDDFDTIDSGAAADELGFDPAALQASIDRNSEVMERALTEGIKGVFNVYGPDGLVAAYDKGKKNASRHGEKY